MGNHSAIILYYNKPTLTMRCVESVLNQKVKPQNLVLINNGSTPSTVDAIDSFFKTKSADLFQINLHTIHIPENLGFSKAMNQGLDYAFKKLRSSTATLISNDAELDSEYFQNLSTMELKTDTIYCPHTHYLMKKNLAYTHGRVSVLTDTHTSPPTKELELSHHTTETTTITFPQYYPAAVTTWTREAYEKIQGFNEEFFCYWEDVELSYRAQKLKVFLESTPLLKVYHLGRGTTGGKAVYNQHFINGKNLMQTLLISFNLADNTIRRPT